MAKDLLSGAAAVAILIGGGAIEVAAGTQLALSVLDWAVGAGLVLVALLAPGRRVDSLALVTAGMWYLATLASTPAGWWHDLDGLLAIAYRGPLLQLLARPTLAARRHRTLLVTLAYAAPFLVVSWAGLATAAAAAVVATLVALATSHAGPPDRRRADRHTAAVLFGLAVVWGPAALGWPTGLKAVLLSDLAVLLATWHIRRRQRASSLTGTVADMVVDLGQDGRPSAPLSASLAAALADPDLRIATHHTTLGWCDEFGNPVGAPVDRHDGRLTIVPIPGGGTLALLHGLSGAGDSDVAESAARAAALLLDSVRLTAEARRTAEDVRQSGIRLMGVEQQERQILAEQLRAGPGRTLARARMMLDLIEPSAGIQPVVERLDQISGDLDRLAHGLHPRAVTNPSLRDALGGIVADATVPTTLNLHGPLDRLPEPTRALIYFCVAECMTNIARHSGAAEATITVVLTTTLRIEIADDGHGGAASTAGRGLQGLADRVTISGGTLTIDSPPAGPTRIVVELGRPVIPLPAQ
jgi:signal transduction histidine kinase